MMNYVKKIIDVLLGIRSHEVNRRSEDANDVNNGHNNLNSVEEIPNHANSNHRRKGISVSVQVPVEIGPIIVPCPAGDGGVQGLNWHTRRLKIDEDGDVADEFLEEIVPEKSNAQGSHRLAFSMFQVKSSAKPVKATSPRLSQEGTVQRFVDFRGRRQLV